MPGYMIVYADADGTPAVWHVGPDEFAAQCTAREKLAKHVRELRAVGFDVTAADFTMTNCRQATP